MTGNARKHVAVATGARSDVYQLLATVFRAEPDYPLIRQLRGPSFSQALTALGMDLGDELRSLPEASLKERLGVEYTRLFLGPGGHISPHESIFAEVDGDCGELWGASTVAVKKFIESTGLAYDEAFSGLPDHISVELEFMRRLIDWECSKREVGAEAGAAYCLRIQRKFLQEHLGTWAPTFCERVTQHAKVAFYREMAVLLREFLDYDRQGIDDALAVDDHGKVSAAST